MCTRPSALLAALALMLAASAALGLAPIGTDLRLDPDDNFSNLPNIAYGDGVYGIVYAEGTAGPAGYPTQVWVAFVDADTGAFLGRYKLSTHEFLVATIYGGADIAYNPVDHEFGVVWWAQTSPSPTEQEDIFFRPIKKDGTSRISEVNVTNRQKFLSLAGIEWDAVAGRYAMLWGDWYPGPIFWRIRMATFDRNGGDRVESAVLGDREVAGAPGTAMAVGPDGYGIALGYYGEAGIYFMCLDRNLNVVTPPALLSGDAGGNVGVTYGDGKFGVVWTAANPPRIVFDHVGADPRTLITHDCNIVSARIKWDGSRFITLWLDARNCSAPQPWFVYGMTHNKYGTNLGDVRIQQNDLPPRNLDVAFKSPGNYCVAWEHHNGAGIYAIRASDDSTPPGPATDFTATAGDERVTLVWTTPSDADFKGTMIRYSTTGYPETPTDGTLLADRLGYPHVVMSHTHTGLVNGTTYYYSLFNHDLFNNYSSGVAGAATPQDVTPPGPVTAFGATGGDGRVSLSWTNPTTSDFKGTMVRYKTNGYPAGPTDGILVADRPNGPGTYDSCVHNGLANGVMCYYSAFTYDEVPNYSSAADKSATPVHASGTTISESAFDTDLDGWSAVTWSAGGVEFGTMTRHGSAGNPEGCMRCAGGGSTDNTDRCRREGGQISKVISTAGYKNIRVSCDLRVNSLGGQYTGAGSGSCAVDHDLIDEQLTVFYSTDGGSSWTEAEWSKRSDLLAGYQSYGTRTIDLSGISGVSNNPSFALRFRWQLNTAGDTADLDNIVVGGEAPDVCIAAAKQLPEGSEVLLVNKVLYLKQGSFGYIEEPDRSSGVRVEGSISASQDDLICLIGTMRTTAGGERYIQVGDISPNGAMALKPLGMSNRALADSLAKGLFVTTWGRVKSGSVTADSYVVTDGSDEAGIKVITPGATGVSEGQYVTVMGAAGFDGSRVIYRR